MTELLYHPALSWLVLEIDVAERDHLHGIKSGSCLVRSVSEQESVPLIVADDPEEMLEYAKSFGNRLI